MPQNSLDDGTTTINLQVFQASSSGISANIVKQKVPERASNLIQFMGNASESISLTCYSTVASDISQLKTWLKAGTILSYSDDDHTGLQVVIEDLSVQEPVSVQANYREFSLSLIEVA